MSKIHYFQRYSQKENVVTNNTLLLLGRLYEESQKKFRSFWGELLGEELSVGIDFAQQYKTKLAIPDGLISQSSFDIVIETKLSNNFDPQQLINHLEAFKSKNAEQQFLLTIGSHHPSAEVSQTVKNHVLEIAPKVRFVPTTFKRIITLFNDVLTDSDSVLRYLIEDYREFCSIEGLLLEDEFSMRMVLAGKSKDENLTYNIYYNNKGFSNHKYIGLYWDKAVRAIGEIEVIARVNIHNDLIEVSPGMKLTDEQKARIIAVAEMAKQINAWDISQGHTFFLVHKFYQTEFRKIGSPPQGSRFFDLRTILKMDNISSTVEELATLLKGKTCQ